MEGIWINFMHNLLFTKIGCVPVLSCGSLQGWADPTYSLVQVRLRKPHTHTTHPTHTCCAHKHHTHHTHVHHMPHTHTHVHHTPHTRAPHTRALYTCTTHTCTTRHTHTGTHVYHTPTTKYEGGWITDTGLHLTLERKIMVVNTSFVRRHERLKGVS